MRRGTWIPNVDDLPVSGNMHLLPPLKRYRSRSRSHPVGYLLTSRGCPSACTFCYRTFGNTFRPHSPQRVVDEISQLIKTQGIRQVDILDDNFTFQPQRTARILDLIIAQGIKNRYQPADRNPGRRGSTENF